MQEELSYSLHLSNDKNKSKKARKMAKQMASKSTPFNNNAIQNSQQLSKVNNHNLRKYDNNQELIEIIYGTNNLYEDTKQLYLDLFEESRIEYNNKQTRNDRKIDNYFNHISTDSKRDLACEVIIEIGDMFFWGDKTDEYKKKMTKVFREQLKDMQKIVPTFKIANAVVHYDEHSPHLHIIGVPIKDGKKNGMSKQVGKSDVFTKDSLTKIQDTMRELCIDSFNKTYNTNMILKSKEIGRNEDIKSSNMEKYYKLKEKIEYNNKRLEAVNKKSNDTIKTSKEVKQIINNLKPTKLNKTNLIISEEDVKIINDYIEKVDSNVSNIKNINDLTIIMEDFENDLQNHDKKVQELEKTISKQSNKIKKYENIIKNKNDTIKEQNEEIEELNKQISNLEKIIEFWKYLWKKILDFLQDKFYSSKKENQIYDNVIVDMVNENILNKDDISYIENDYSKSNNKDDYEI